MKHRIIRAVLSRILLAIFVLVLTISSQTQCQNNFYNSTGIYFISLIMTWQTHFLIG